MIPSASQEPEKIAMDWTITEFTPSKMKIKLDFSEPLHVSFEEPDILQIYFADPDLFISEDGISIQEQDRIIERQLMR